MVNALVSESLKRSFQNRIVNRQTAVFLAVLLLLLNPQRGRGEDQFSYRFESYREDDSRIRVVTQSLLFSKALTSWLGMKAEYVYDAISGATPTGAPPSSTVNFTPPGPFGPVSSKVGMENMKDERGAFNLELPIKLGKHSLTPQFSYSQEHDYISQGWALNYAIELNEKNTTLNLGWARANDRILPHSRNLTTIEHKTTDDFLFGVTQLLGPKTLLTANFTYGHAHGYLDDQYKGVFFEDYPQFFPDTLTLFPEKRPRQRDKQILYLALNQAVTPLRGSVEGSYRLYRDDFGITAHTVGLTWLQKIGRIFVVAPTFRYYRQTAADFYATRFPGDKSLPVGALLPNGNPNPAPPEYYSCDYRLSEMETFTYGVKVTARLADWFTFDFRYQRYHMHGLDGVTSQSAYPRAHIFTLGGRIWF